MKQATRADAKMWGPSIVDFGHRVITYPNGRELDWRVVGFSPRKANRTLYLPGGLDIQQKSLAKLGRHTTGKGCLYIKRLSDVDTKVLKEMITRAVKSVRDGDT